LIGALRRPPDNAAPGAARFGWGQRAARDGLLHGGGARREALTRRKLVSKEDTIFVSLAAEAQRSTQRRDDSRLRSEQLHSELFPHSWLISLAAQRWRFFFPVWQRLLI
jgi:hypothetical protein